jgi:hypothetical protein
VPSGDCARCSTRAVCPVSSASFFIVGYQFVVKTVTGALYVWISRNTQKNKEGNADVGYFQTMSWLLV